MLRMRVIALCAHNVYSGNHDEPLDMNYISELNRNVIHDVGDKTDIDLHVPII